MACELKLAHRHVLLSLHIFKENLTLIVFCLKHQEISPKKKKSGLTVSLEQWDGVEHHAKPSPRSHVTTHCPYKIPSLCFMDPIPYQDAG